MSMYTLIIVLLVLLLVGWLLQRYVLTLLTPPWGSIVLAVYVLAICLWLLSIAGILPPMGAVRVG